MAPTAQRRPTRPVRPSPSRGLETRDEEPKRKAVQPFSIGPVKPVGIRPMNALIFGPYGGGKTTLAGSAEDVASMRDVLFINAESGDMSLTDKRSLDVININKYSQMARIFEYLTQHCVWRDEGNTDKLLEYERQFKSVVIPIEDQTEPVEEGRTWFVEQRLRTGRGMDEPFMYHTVILDSLSELHKYLVYQFTGVEIGEATLDVEVERMEEWQSAQEMFRLMIRSFRDLPLNVIMVSAETIQDPDRKKGEKHAKALPKLAGQMAGDVAGFIDIVGYLAPERKDGELTRRLYLGAGYEDFISKHRFQNLPDLDYIDNPTMQSLIDLSRKDAEAHGSTHTPNVEGHAVIPSRRRPDTAASQRRTGASPSGTGGSGAGAGRRGRGNPVRRSR